MAVQFAYCRKCGECPYGRSSGKINDPDRKWFEFWKKVECPECEGTGMAKAGPRPKFPPPSISQLRRRL